MKPTTRQLAVWAALALAVAASELRAQLVRTVDAGSGLYASQVGDRATVREPSGGFTELSLPPGTTLQRLAPLAGGWLVAGEIETAGISDLYLLRSEDGVLGPFPAPANEAADPLRGGPMPLVEQGRLVGLAWLSGAGVRRTAVYASGWSGLDWSQPELVGPVGPGTQIAVDGAVLADGSWLLVWAAWDGGDDEILWSRRAGGRWSVPAPLHPPNDVPDITPALVATGRGALAAWNAYDGETYRVRLAAFEDPGWRQLDLAGPAGSVRPGLTPREGGALLLFRTVAPPSWTVYELDDRGAPLRRATVETETPLRPGLTRVGEATLGFAWPGETVTAPLRGDAGWQAEP
jgi:hypothetical protein